MINNIKKIVAYIPFAIIAVLTIYSIYVVVTTNIIFSYEHYIGFVLVLVALLSLWYNLKVHKWATFLALLLVTFGQAAFTPIITRYSVGFTIEGKGGDIIIQPYYLCLIVLFIVLNRGFLREAFEDKDN